MTHQCELIKERVCAMTNDTWRLVRYRHHPESDWHYGLVVSEYGQTDEVDVDTVDLAHAKFILSNFLGIHLEAGEPASSRPAEVVTLFKGGELEREINIRHHDIPDLWHLAMWLQDNPDKVCKNWGRMVLDTWHLAHDLKRHIAETGQEPAPAAEVVDEFDACPQCGCTDIEISAWVHANTGKLSNSQGPLDSAWCPQCEANGEESMFRARDAAKTTVEQQYQERTR